MPKPCIIITRPIVDAQRTAELLNFYGLDYFIEPVLTVEYLLNKETAAKQLFGKDGVIITSKNAARAIVSIVPKNIKIISIGVATSSFLKDEGYFQVEYAGENVSQLCQYISNNYRDNNFLYFSGKSISQELTYKNCGNNITRFVLYKTIAGENFSKEFVDRLKQGDFNGVMFLSKKTAKAFYEIIISEQLELYLNKLYAFCFSEDIAKYLQNYGFKATIPTKNPALEENIRNIARFWFPKNKL